jgi:hypothetical protein
LERLEVFDCPLETRLSAKFLTPGTTQHGTAVLNNASHSTGSQFNRLRLHHSGIPCEKPVTLIPRANASLVTARIAAFIPGAAPPLVSTPRRFTGIVARAGRPLVIP